MARWMLRRWVWAGVTAAAVVACADAQTAKPPLDKDTMILKFQGQPDRKVKVVKTTRQPDGKVATEVKDLATGETFTLLDMPAGAGDAAPPAAKDAKTTKEAALPKAKPRTSDPITPEPIRPPLTTTAKPSAPPAALPVPDPVPPEQPPAKRPGLIGRLFGKKPASPPQAMPPKADPAPVSSKGFSVPPAGASSSEPPRAMPPRGNPPPKINPPQPVIPAPLPIPLTPPPGGPQSKGGAVQVVLPVGYVPPAIAMTEELRPHVTELQNALAPSARMTAAKSLAGGRHGSSEQVKAALFAAAKTDPCPAVRACCIEELCKLGYFAPEFVAHVKACCDDPNDDVKAAAKAAAAKMTPRK